MFSFFNLSTDTTDGEIETIQKNGIIQALIIGDCYRDGYLVNQDKNLAIKFYMKAANEGKSDAWFRLGKLYEMYGHKNDAINSYKKGCNLGNDACELRLLELTHSGDQQAKNLLMKFDKPSRQLKPTYLKVQTDKISDYNIENKSSVKIEENKPRRMLQEMQNRRDFLHCVFLGKLYYADKGTYELASYQPFADYRHNYQDLERQRWINLGAILAAVAAIIYVFAKRWTGDEFSRDDDILHAGLLLFIVPLAASRLFLTDITYEATPDLYKFIEEKNKYSFEKTIIIDNTLSIDAAIKYFNQFLNGNIVGSNLNKIISNITLELSSNLKHRSHEKLLFEGIRDIMSIPSSQQLKNTSILLRHISKIFNFYKLDNSADSILILQKNVYFQHMVAEALQQYWHAPFTEKCLEVTCMPLINEDDHYNLLGIGEFQRLLHLLNTIETQTGGASVSTEIYRKNAYALVEQMSILKGVIPGLIYMNLGLHAAYWFMLSSHMENEDELKLADENDACHIIVSLLKDMRVKEFNAEISGKLWNAYMISHIIRCFTAFRFNKGTDIIQPKEALNDLLIHCLELLRATPWTSLLQSSEHLLKNHYALLNIDERKNFETSLLSARIDYYSNQRDAISQSDLKNFYEIYENFIMGRYFPFMDQSIFEKVRVGFMKVLLKEKNYDIKQVEKNIAYPWIDRHPGGWITSELFSSIKHNEIDFFEKMNGFTIHYASKSNIPDKVDFSFKRWKSDSN